MLLLDQFCGRIGNERRLDSLLHLHLRLRLRLHPMPDRMTGSRLLISVQLQALRFLRGRIGAGSTLAIRAAVSLGISPRHLSIRTNGELTGSSCGSSFL